MQSYVEWSALIPELNYVITDEWGQAAVWPDGAYPEERIALQYDGVHHADPIQVRSDTRRRTVTERLGWREVRVFKEDLEGDKPFVIEKIKAVMRFGGHRQRTTRTGTWGPESV
ncbi:hypothetical protein [Arthrobacter sp. ISL-72]|uniref:hypothetical protein n=1 Tax=Arthrobacter sp. ISL-72 TaxID=2819114 RepID=UPI001BE7E4F8|nr:hypothetical protein [Arthrobacter sp. ISL-72]MBT2595550.1 hypothetical protein [Arthrobacter sp. ISL-72]